MPDREDVEASAGDDSDEGDEQVVEEPEDGPEHPLRAEDVSALIQKIIA